MPTACLECGSQIEHEWAACPRCGWKAPEAWEAEDDAEEEAVPRHRAGVMAKPRAWVRVLAWAVLGFIALWLYSNLR